MALADLRRLVHRATPRVEDVRSPDRTDFVRRHHGHLTLQEALDALDALEFSAGSFVCQMRHLPGPDTALHGLLHAVEGLRVLSPAWPVPAPMPMAAPVVPAATATEGWQERVATAKGEGAELFRSGQFTLAAEAYARAVSAAPMDAGELPALHSNRAAALLRAGDTAAALADARRCVELAPEWPKSHFREGCCLRQLGHFGEALGAFARGAELEPGNEDWARERERTEKAQWSEPTALVRQLVLRLLPELLGAWVRGGDCSGVLQVQINGDLKGLGTPKWRLLHEGQSDAKAQLRYAFLGKNDYLRNLAANLQKPPAQGVAVLDFEGKPLKISEITSFFYDDEHGGLDSEVAHVHMDVRDGANMMKAIICRIPSDGRVRGYIGMHKDPAPPRGSIDGVLQLQQQSGFPRVLPRLLGFQSFPGDLNFPVIDLERDAAGGVNGGC